MKLKIFTFAFLIGFIFCFSFAVFFVFNFSGNGYEKLPENSSDDTFFPENKNAVFLLIYENESGFGPFSLVNFDTENGRIPVFTFSKNAAIDYGGVSLPASELLNSVSVEIFAGVLESDFDIELSGYFIWDRDAAEKIISKTGTFDYVLPEKLSYSDKNGVVNLASGVQSMNGKKFCDIIEYPNFSEGERCDTVSRMIAAFFNRRLKHFLPESKIYSVLFNYTKTDVSAFDKEIFSKLAETLCSSGESLSGHITNDTELSTESGLLYFSDDTKSRIKKYFG